MSICIPYRLRTNINSSTMGISGCNRTVSQKGKCLPNLSPKGQDFKRSEVRSLENIEYMLNALRVEWCRSAQEPDWDRFNPLKQINIILSGIFQESAPTSLWQWLQYQLTNMKASPCYRGLLWCRDQDGNTQYTLFYNTHTYILSFHQPIGRFFKWETQERFVDKRTRFLAMSWTSF